MTWTYEVNKKAFSLNGKYQFSAMYAGAPGYKDNTEFECVKEKGPLPRGRYKIGRPMVKHPEAGLYVLRLIPCPGNHMCGRAGFLIHGGNGKGTASKGCIVLANRFRHEIADSLDFELIVI